MCRKWQKLCCRKIKRSWFEMKLSGNQDEALYRELLLGQCHALHHAMPFLFEAVDDEAELLLPDNLTRTDSILRGLVDDIPEEDWEHVEVIGWLYQFYISEKKDAVIGKVVKSEDIPAATQLFYAKLDCAVSGTELRWPPVVADLPGLAAERQNGVLH
ncbi:restriction enzyme [Escherichia coli]|nr:restriction enzyme [Escherichia coli]